MKKNQNKYLNFPVSFLKNPSLDVILELALQFCSYEMMVLNNGDKSYFDSLVQSIGFSVDKFSWSISTVLCSFFKVKICI